uniref:Zinc finger protein 366 n=1 Tax=Culex pipiens TaxID=7175 RepID=A0A8D8EZJ6_CULPI
MEESPELVDSSSEATADEEEASLVCDEVDLRDVLSTEIEIKEEEVELDEGTFLPADDTPDPIGGDAARYDDSETGASTASADEAVRKEALEFQSRKRRVKKSGSSTESADEVGGRKKRRAKPAMTVKRKRRKPKFDGLVMPRFVPGMMVQRSKKYLCLECGQQLDSIFRFATHTKRWHLAALPRYPHCCFYCPRKFRGKRALHRHLLIHSRLEPLRCPICRGTYHSAFGMANHLEIHKAEALTVQKNPEVTQQNFKNSIYSKNVTPLDNVCFVCGATEASEDDLKTHLKTAHQGMLQCKACYEMVPTAAELLDHVDTVHNNQAELTYYRCPLQHCSRSFLSAADMRKHSQACVPPPPKPASRPHSGTPMVCDICGLTYYELDHFVTHMRLHGTLSRETTGYGNCKLCAFVVKSPGEQALHMVQRHGYRDRLASLVDAYGKLNIVPPKEEEERGRGEEVDSESGESSDGG